MHERRLRFAASIVVPLTRLALAVLPFRAVLRLARAAARPARPSTLSPEQIVRIVESVAKRTNCLTTVVAAALFLTRYGHPAAIRLGVAAGETRAAHAWLECDGRGILGTPAPGKFVVLPPLWLTAAPSPASAPSAASET